MTYAISSSSSEPPVLPGCVGSSGAGGCAMVLLPHCVPERFCTSLAPAAVFPAEVNVN